MLHLLVAAMLEHAPSRGCGRRQGWLPSGTDQCQQPLQHSTSQKSRHIIRPTGKQITRRLLQ